MPKVTKKVVQPIWLKRVLKRIRALRRNAKQNGAGTAVDYLNLLEKWMLGTWSPKRGYISDCPDCKTARKASRK